MAWDNTKPRIPVDDATTQQIHDAVAQYAQGDPAKESEGYGYYSKALIDAGYLPVNKDMTEVKAYRSAYPGGALGDVVRAGERGFANAALGLVEAPAELLNLVTGGQYEPEVAKEWRGYIGKQRERINTELPEEPNVGFGRKVARGVASALPYVVEAAGTKNPAVIAGLFGGQGYASGSEESANRGESGLQRIGAGVATGVPQAVMGEVIGGVTNPLTRAIASRAGKAVAQVATGAATLPAMNEATKAGMYLVNGEYQLPTLPEVGEQAAVGGIIGLPGAFRGAKRPPLPEVKEEPVPIQPQIGSPHIAGYLPEESALSRAERIARSKINLENSEYPMPEGYNTYIPEQGYPIELPPEGGRLPLPLIPERATPFRMMEKYPRVQGVELTGRGYPIELGNPNEPPLTQSDAMLAGIRVEQALLDKVNEANARRNGIPTVPYTPAEMEVIERMYAARKNIPTIQPSELPTIEPEYSGTTPTQPRTPLPTVNPTPPLTYEGALSRIGKAATEADVDKILKVVKASGLSGDKKTAIENFAKSKREQLQIPPVSPTVEEAETRQVPATDEGRVEDVSEVSRESFPEPSTKSGQPVTRTTETERTETPMVENANVPELTGKAGELPRNETAVSKGKEPELNLIGEIWETPKQDYMNRVREIADKLYTNKKQRDDYIQGAEKRHRNEVESRLKNGRGVPPEVLKDYPDWQKRLTPKGTQPLPASAGNVERKLGYDEDTGIFTIPTREEYRNHVLNTPTADMDFWLAKEHNYKYGEKPESKYDYVETKGRDWTIKELIDERNRLQSIKPIKGKTEIINRINSILREQGAYEWEAKKPEDVGLAVRTPPSKWTDFENEKSINESYDRMHDKAYKDKDYAERVKGKKIQIVEPSPPPKQAWEMTKEEKRRNEWREQREISAKDGWKLYKKQSAQNAWNDLDAHSPQLKLGEEAFIRDYMDRMEKNDALKNHFLNIHNIVPKNDWEMTKLDYLSMMGYKPIGAKVKPKEGWWYAEKNKELRAKHEQLVKQALSEGKPVPPEVLADYPDLAGGKEGTKAETKPIETKGAEVTVPKEIKLTLGRDGTPLGSFVNESNIHDNTIKVGDDVRYSSMGTGYGKVVAIEKIPPENDSVSGKGYHNVSLKDPDNGEIFTLKHAEHYGIEPKDESAKVEPIPAPKGEETTPTSEPTRKESLQVPETGETNLEPERVTKARKRLNSNLGNVSMNPMFNPEVWTDLATLGSYHIGRGVKTLADFTLRMKEELGDRWDSVKDKIADIYRQSKLVHEVPKAYTGIAKDVESRGNELVYRTVRNPEEAEQILQGIQDGDVTKGFRPASHIDGQQLSTKAPKIARSVEKGGVPIFTSPYPTVSHFYGSSEWGGKGSANLTFAIEYNPNSLIHESSRVNRTQSKSYSMVFPDAERVIDARGIKKVYLVTPEQRDLIGEHHANAKEGYVQGAYRGAFKDKDAELSKANMDASRNLEPVLKSLGREYLETPITLDNGLQVKKGDRVRLVNGATGVLGIRSIPSEEQSRLYWGEAKQGFELQQFKGELPEGAHNRYNIYDKNISAVWDKVNRKWIEVGSQPSPAPATQPRKGKGKFNTQGGYFNPDAFKGLDPKMKAAINDAIARGVEHIRNGVTEFKAWVKEMAKTLGSAFKTTEPYMRDIYREARAEAKKNPSGMTPEEQKVSSQYDKAPSFVQRIFSKEPPSGEEVKGVAKESVSDAYNSFRRQFSEAAIDMINAAKRMGVPREEIEADIRQSRMNEGLRDTWFRKGMTPRDLSGKALDVKPFEEIIEPFKNKVAWNKFWAYATARHDIEVEKSNPGYFENIRDPHTRRIILGGAKNTKDLIANAEKVVAAGKDAFEKSFQELQEWNKAALKVYLESGGRLEDFPTITGKRETYIPLFHSVEQGGGYGFLTPDGKFADLRSGIRKLGEVGGDVKRMHPADAELNHIGELLTLATRERVGKKFVEAWKDYSKNNPNDASNILELVRLEPNEVFNPRTRAARQIIRVGKEYYHVPDKMLFDAFEGMNPEQLNVLTKVLQKSSSMFRMFVVENPAFSVYNAIRDGISQLLFTRTHFKESPEMAIPFVSLAKGMKEILGKTEDVQRLYAAGGASPISQFITGGRESGVNSELFHNRTLYYSKHPVEAVKVFTSLIENATRVGEGVTVARELMNKGVDPVEAFRKGAEAARKVSLEFERSGKTAKQLNRVIPFLNANILGMQQAFVESNPIKIENGKIGLRNRGLTVALRGLAYLGTTTAMLYMLNKDEKWYKEQPPYIKDNFWLFKSGDQIYRIPKPHILGMTYGTTVERVLQDAEKNDPDAYKGLLVSFLNTTPFDISSTMPQAVRGWIEAAANYDFYRNQAIIPEAVKNASPENQVNEYTSTLARKMGEYFGVSPAKVEHILKSYTGQLALDVVKLTDADEQKKEWTAKDVPIYGRLLVRAPTMGSSVSVSRFYDEYERLRGDNTAKTLTIPQKQVYRLFTTTATNLSELRKQRKLLLSKQQTPEIKQRIQGIDERAIELAQKARARALVILQTPNTEKK